MPAAILFRLAGLAGVLGGALIVLAAARRGGVVPENALTHALAPPGSALSLFALTGIYLWQRGSAGVLGLVGYVVNLLGLVGLFGIEFVTHAVYPYQDRVEIAGPTRAYFLAVAFTFLVGVVLFGLASWRAKVLPRGAVTLYLLGFVPAALRTAVPEAVYLGGLVVGVAGVAWLSVLMLRGRATAGVSMAGGTAAGVTAAG